MDLMEMIPYAKINDGYKYILTCIDVFSRVARALPLKSKSAEDVSKAITIMFQNEKPRHLQTDLGKEFYNSKVKVILTKLQINHYSVYSQYKAALVERFNRTLRERLAKYFVAQGNKKWVQVLPKLIVAYNHTVHKSIGVRPVDVSSDVAFNLWSKQNKIIKPKKPKYKVGEYVRISRLKASPFNKNFDHNWSDEVFQIVKVDTNTSPVMYRIKDYENEEIQGKFYEQELQVISKPAVFRIEKILQTKGKGENKQYYVKWHEYSKPSWIKASDIV
jgi:hypothetical protein